MNTKKQTIIVFCLVLAAALLCVQTASAGSMNAGDSFDTATQIEPGFYEDEITDDEEKYSYIEIKPGQEFIFKTTLDAGSYYSFIVEFFDMDRSKIGENNINIVGDSGSFYYLTSSEKELYRFYIRIKTKESTINKYHTSISIEDHFDAKSETDAGDTFNDALSISSGKYEGGLAHTQNNGNDWKDYYRLSVQSGDKVDVALMPSGEERLTLSIFNEDRECVKTEESKEAGSIARTQWLADSSQYIYILVDGTYRHLPSSTQYRGGDYTLDITTGKAPAHEKQIPPESKSNSESESEKQPGFGILIALISLVGVYIGLRKM